MRIKGLSDDVTTCECCGKSGLKCTVVLEVGEGETYYGRDCAARALHRTAKNVEQIARNGGQKVQPIRWGALKVETGNVYGDYATEAEAAARGPGFVGVRIR